MPLGLSLGLQSATEDAVLPRIKWYLLLQPREEVPTTAAIHRSKSTYVVPQP